jgi:uncharacterized protein
MGHWETVRIPEDFDGIVRLFPLPDLVLFPHVIQALHIFEPRYCDMLSEALEADKLITMALLVPGWEGSYQGKPKISDMVCIGRIISHTPTSDGRHNILLAGIHRAKIVEELDAGTTFRQARVELVKDYMPDEFAEHESEHRDTLLHHFRFAVPAEAAGSKAFADLLTQQLPIGVLTDIMAYALTLSLPVKHRLLLETNVQRRFELLMDELRLKEDQDLGGSSVGKSIAPSDVEGATMLDRDRGQFPPPFSDN